MTAHVGFTDRVMAFFKANPSRWINAVELEPVGGRQAWRSRVAEARLKFKAAGEGTILNRQYRQRVDGRTWTRSEYLFQPAEPVQPSGSRPHDLNQGFQLR